MPKGYWIAHIDVTDPEKYKDYVARGSQIYARYGATPIVRGGQFEAPEGSGRARNVVVEFDSYARALECYNSPEYQEAAKIRRASSDSELIIVEGA